MTRALIVPLSFLCGCAAPGVYRASRADLQQMADDPVLLAALVVLAACGAVAAFVLIREGIQ